MAEIRHNWSFLSNYAHVLICIAKDPEVRVRDIASMVGITERAVQRILKELEEFGVIHREREGRRNHYGIDGSKHLRHPLEAEHTINEVLQVLVEEHRVSVLPEVTEEVIE